MKAQHIQQSLLKINNDLTCHSITFKSRHAFMCLWVFGLVTSGGPWMLCSATFSTLQTTRSFVAGQRCSLTGKVESVQHEEGDLQVPALWTEPMKPSLDMSVQTSDGNVRMRQTDVKQKQSPLPFYPRTTWCFWHWLSCQCICTLVSIVYVQLNTSGMTILCNPDRAWPCKCMYPI